MARTALSPAQRADNVKRAAVDALAALSTAERVTAQHGHGSPEALKAWSCVEIHGATVHRQARLLAGKSRGG